MRGLAILLAATLLLAMVPGIGSAQPAGGKSAAPAAQSQVAEKPAAHTPSAKKYTAQERKSYQEKATQDMAKAQERIDVLQNSYVTARPQVKRTYLKVLHGLKKKQSEAQDQLTALEKAPAGDWGSHKAEMDKKLQELTASLQEAEATLQQ